MKKVSLSGIKNFFKKLFGKEVSKKKIIKKILGLDEIEKLGKEVEQSRGYDRGLLAKEKVRVEKLKKQLKPKDVNISKLLNKQQQSLLYSQFQRAFSWKKFFQLYSRKPEKFRVLSYDFKKDFGQFYDISTLRDGRWALLIKTKEEKIQPLITARTSKELFRNFGGLSNVANKGYFLVNLDEKGNFVENILEKEIPHIIIDKNGKFKLSERSVDTFINQLTEKQNIIDEQDEMIGTYEDTLRKEIGDKNLLNLQNNFNRTRAIVAETDLTKGMKEVEEIHRGLRKLTKENVALAQHKAIEYDRAEYLEGVRKEIMDKMEEIASLPGVKIAEGKYEDIANWIMGLVLPAIGERKYEPKKEEPKKETSKLEQKYG